MNMIAKIFAGGTAPAPAPEPVVAPKPAAKRIYEVGNSVGLPIRLVKAQSRAQAISHVIGSAFAADIPGQDRLVELITQGCVVEDSL